MWNTWKNVACVQQKLKRERWKGDGGENGQEENTRMTSEFAAHPSASQSLHQHEYQRAAADRQDQMKKGEEEREQGLWGNDEAVKGNNCRCFFFFFFPKLKGDQPMQMWAAMLLSSQSDTWAEPHKSCRVRASYTEEDLPSAKLGSYWDSTRKTCSLLDCSLGLVLWVVCNVVSLCVSCVCLLVCACSDVDVSVRGKCCRKNTRRRIKWKVSKYWESTGRGTQQSKQKTNKQNVFLGRGSYGCRFLPFFPSSASSLHNFYAHSALWHFKSQLNSNGFHNDPVFFKIDLTNMHRCKTHSWIFW